ncbi:iron ABC transporter permease [Halobacteriales archaeon QS_3_64_16]|nr:MAG: iron ABC transporter permease [Halobacteriales archaeon QS_3_64_16]
MRGQLEDGLPWALGLGAAALLALVFYYPVATVLIEAVSVAGRVTVEPIVGILTDPFYVGWLARAITDPGTFGRALLEAPIATLTGSLGLIGFTAYQALLSAIACVALGVPGAYVLARYEFPGREVIRSLTILPFVMPSIMVAIGFVSMFGESGTLNQVLRALGLGEIEVLFTLPIVILAHAFYNAPLVTRVTAAAWESIDARRIESARSLGASPQRAFRDVVVPQLLPAIATGAVLAYIFSFMSFAIVLALGGLGFATIEVWIYNQVTQLEYASAAALATIETSISLGLTYLYLRYEASQEGIGEGGGGGRPLNRKPLFGSLTPTRIAVGGYLLVVGVVFVGPIASMIVASLTNDAGFTLANYDFLLSRQRTAYSFQVQPLDAILNSLLFAAGSLVLSVPIGTFVAIVSTRRFRGRKVIDALAMAPIAVSGVVVGLGLLRGLVFGVEVWGYRITVTGTVAIIAAHAVAAYPFVVRNLTPLLGGLDRRLTESARSLGASPARAFLDISLPLVWGGVLAGAAFAVAISIGEFDSTVILATGTESYTMPVAVERYLGRRLGPATAMGCVLLGVTSGAFLVVERFGDRGGLL